jgi:hypothetical protein
MPELFTATRGPCAISAERPRESRFRGTNLKRDQPGIVGDDRPRDAGGGVDLRDTAIEQLTGELTARRLALRAGLAIADLNLAAKQRG